MKHSAKTNSRINVFHLIIQIGIIMFIFGCQNPLTFKFAPPPEHTKSQIQKVAVSGSQFTLAWDDDALGPDTFSVYARPFGESQWKSIAKGVTSYSLTITSRLLSFGNYEFAVSRVSVDGTESNLLTSLDASAIPNTGWYLEWTQ